MPQGNHAYIDHVRRLEQRLGSGNDAVRLAVGGEFEAVGKLEYYLLRSLGIKPLGISLSMSAAVAGDWRSNWPRIRAFATSGQMSSLG
jgi:hypothetical protein